MPKQWLKKTRERRGKFFVAQAFTPGSAVSTFGKGPFKGLLADKESLLKEADI